MKKAIIAVLTLLGLASCSPRVVTDMFTKEFAPTSADSVRLFRYGQPVPPHTRAIGEVKVVDNGFSTGGSLERVMQLAFDATAKNGGNGLLITKHRSPDMKSTIHRVWGTILRIPDDALPTMAPAYRPIAPTDSVTISRMEYEEFRRYQSERAEFQAMLLRRDSIMDNAPRNVYRVSVGPSWLASTYQLGNRLYKSRSGIDMAVDYEHVWRSGLGFGINYMRNNSTFDEGWKTRIDYIGPSVVLSYPFGNMRYNLAVGAGYCRYSESSPFHSHSENKISPLIRIGLEYRVFTHMAFGVQMDIYSLHMDKPDDVILEKGEVYGIQRAGLKAGVSVYF